MNKQQILNITGLTEKEFYSRYPDQESFCNDYPQACAQLAQAAEGIEVTGSLTSPEEVQKLGKAYGFRTDSNKNFQQDMYNYVAKNKPELFKESISKFGPANAGLTNYGSVQGYRPDAYIGPRVADMMGKLGTPQAPRQPQAPKYVEYSKANVRQQYDFNRGMQQKYVGSNVAPTPIPSQPAMPATFPGQQPVGGYAQRTAQQPSQQSPAQPFTQNPAGGWNIGPAQAPGQPAMPARQQAPAQGGQPQMSHIGPWHTNAQGEYTRYYTNQQGDMNPGISASAPAASPTVQAYGGEMIKRADGSYSKRGLWDNIRANKGSGKKPTKEMLEQEDKINAQYAEGGEQDETQQSIMAALKQGMKPQEILKKLVAMGLTKEQATAYIKSAVAHPASQYDNTYVNDSSYNYMDNGGEMGQGGNIEDYGGGMFAEGGNFEDTELEDPVTYDGEIKKYSDPRHLESGMITDKNKGVMYVIKNGKSIKTFPVMTALNKDLNKNPYGVAYLDKHPEKRATPVGNYLAVPMPNIYGRPGFDLRPISAFGQPAPVAASTAIHTLYGDGPKGSHSYDPVEYKKRLKIMAGPGVNRVGSYGCTNMYGQDINCLTGELFPKGDTNIIIDSRIPADRRFINNLLSSQQFGGEMKYGGIHLDPAKKGTFKAQATRMGMSVQQAASHILANKEDYSPAMVKKANFAKNFAKEEGGQIMMALGGEPNGGMALGQMAAVVDKMSKLRKFVSPDQNLDPWIASKLAVMDHSADAISDYMMYNPEAQGKNMEDMMTYGGMMAMGGQPQNAGFQALPEYVQEKIMNNMAEGGELDMYGSGGYVVKRSSARKGKTHVVIGPDGTKKYFGDSNLGQHPKDPERKAAFYARHKTNLKNNPYFRAYARATWAEGGEPDVPGMSELNHNIIPFVYEDPYLPAGFSVQSDSSTQAPSIIPTETVSNEIPVSSQSSSPINYKGVSIVDLLNSVGKPSDYSSRKELAKNLGISNYRGSAAQNAQLIKMLVQNSDLLDQNYSGQEDNEEVVSVPRSFGTKNNKSTYKRTIPTSLPNNSTNTGSASSKSLTTPESVNKLRQIYLAVHPELAAAEYNAQINNGYKPQVATAATSLAAKNLRTQRSNVYDDSYMLNQIANDPHSPANVGSRKRKEFARDLAIGTLAPWLAENALMAATTKYFPYGLQAIPEVASRVTPFYRALPQASKLLPSGTRALPAASRLLGYKQGGYVGMDGKFHMAKGSGTFSGNAYYALGGEDPNLTAPYDGSNPNAPLPPFDPSAYQAMQLPTGNVGYSKKDPATGQFVPIDNVRKDDLWKHLSGSQRWNTGQTVTQKVGRGIGKIDDALNTGLVGAEAYSNYLKNNEAQNEYNNYTQNMGTTASLYGINSPAASRGDYSVTGSTYGTLKPNQYRQYSKMGGAIDQYASGGGYISDELKFNNMDAPMVFTEGLANASNSYSAPDNTTIDRRFTPRMLPFNNEDNQPAYNKSGTDIATKLNNPTNMIYHPWMSKLGAQRSNIKQQDGDGFFAHFPDIDTALKAYETQLFGEVDGVFDSRYYKPNTTVDKALRTWSGNGYGGNIYPEIANKPLSSVTAAERRELAKRQIKSESGAMYSKLKSKGYFEMGGSYQEGGIVEMSDTEIKQFLANGGQLEFLD